MGFDGKTLIHPGQVEHRQRGVGAIDAEVEHARASHRRVRRSGRRGPRRGHRRRPDDREPPRRQRPTHAGRRRGHRRTRLTQIEAVRHCAGTKCSLYAIGCIEYDVGHDRARHPPRECVRQRSRSRLPFLERAGRPEPSGGGRRRGQLLLDAGRHPVPRLLQPTRQRQHRPPAPQAGRGDQGAGRPAVHRRPVPRQRCAQRGRPPDLRGCRRADRPTAI